MFVRRFHFRVMRFPGTSSHNIMKPDEHTLPEVLGRERTQEPMAIIIILLVVLISKPILHHEQRYRRSEPWYRRGIGWKGINNHLEVNKHNKSLKELIWLVDSYRKDCIGQSEAQKLAQRNRVYVKRRFA